MSFHVKKLASKYTLGTRKVKRTNKPSVFKPSVFVEDKKWALDPNYPKEKMDSVIGEESGTRIANIRHLAERAGVTRLKKFVPEYARLEMYLFVQEIIKSAAATAATDDRTMLELKDLLFAFQSLNITLMDKEEDEDEKKRVKPFK